MRIWCHVACRWQPFRWFTYSCNGFHEEANERKYGGIGNLWKDVMQRHAQQPYHLQVRMTHACRPGCHTPGTVSAPVVLGLSLWIGAI